MENIMTEQLTIRRFKVKDGKDLYDYLSDPKVLRFEPYGVFTEDQAKDEAIRRSTYPSFYAVCLRENDRLIGNLYLGKGDFDTWELGFVFNGKYQGRGYASESAKALIDHAFLNLGARRIIAMCSPKNVRSRKLLERLGMRREGLLLQNVYFKTDSEGEPVWLDTLEYAMLKAEWSEQRV